MLLSLEKHEAMGADYTLPLRLSDWIQPTNGLTSQHRTQDYEV